MRRGTGIALTALLLSLAFHVAVLLGVWGWTPIGPAPVDAPVVEARLLLDPPPAVARPAIQSSPLPTQPAPPPARGAQPVAEAPETLLEAGPVATQEPADASTNPDSSTSADPLPASSPAPPAPEAESDVPLPPRLNPLPPRIDMRFSVHYGVASGEQTLVWVSDGERYTLTSVAAATGLTGLFYRGRFVQTSSGRLTPWGLQPEMFWDQRGDKRTSANLDAASGRVSLTTASGETRHYPYQRGMQDVLSLFLHLALTAPPTGDALRMPVFNGKKVREYVFELEGEALLETELGSLRTLHLRRVADADGQFEAWLAIERGYLPVKVRRSDDKGNSMELRVRSLSF